VNDETTVWAHRMDHYWKMGNSSVHYMQILISLAIIVICAIIVSQILACTLNRNFKIVEMLTLSKNARRSERGERRAAGDDQELTSLTTNKRRPVEAENVAWKKI
jgi:hypothetical protein